MAKEQKLIDTTTDTGGYILGLLWGSLSLYENGFWFRHRDRWYVETVKSYFGITTVVQKVSSGTGPQYRLKIVRPKWVEPISSLLGSRDWQPRNAQERPYPSGNLSDRGFIRAWVEMHSSVDVIQARHRNGLYYPQKRLRIYGNWALLEEMNYILSAATGLRLRKLQPTENKITKGLYYHGYNVSVVSDWLYDGAEIWHPKSREKLVGLP